MGMLSGKCGGTMGTRAVVIGAGFGGLAAAIRLRAMGYETEVLEAGHQAGGRARVFHRDGFTFDAGPTVLTAPHLVDELFRLLGRRREDYAQLTPISPLYRVSFPDGTHFDYEGTDEALERQVRDLSPTDVHGYRQLSDHARRIFEVGYLQFADRPFHRLEDMLKIVPDLVSVRGYRSVHALVASYIKDERLRQVFTFEPLLIGGNPLRAPAIYLLIHWLERQWGVHYVLGGTGRLVEGLVRLLHEFDVPVRLGAAVERIATDGGRVTGVHLESGEFVPADLVVCNADPTRVYARMLDRKHLRTARFTRLLRQRHSASLFVGYFGTRRQFPHCKHHTIFLDSEYRNLLRDIFDRRVLSGRYALYLHAPSRTDPTVAPEGCDAFYVLAPVPNQLSEIDWSTAAEETFDRILDVLEARCLPGLRDSLVTQFAVDPRYFEGELRSHVGAAFGLEPTLTQSAYFRYHNAAPGIAGLFFVGASTHPGAGIPGVLCSAKVLERVVPRPPHRSSSN